jgi:hypothetical protein
MKGSRTNILIWALPLAGIEGTSLLCDLVLRGNAYHTVNTLPLLAILSLSASFIYLRGLKYMGVSIYCGLMIGILKMNYTFYLEGLNGQGTMNGAYALFICLNKGIFAGLIIDAAFAISERLVQTGRLRKGSVEGMKDNGD